MRKLSDILKGKVVICGIGNIMRGDDAFGPELVKALNGNVRAICIDAGTAPENYIGKIAKQSPDTVIIADVAHFDAQAGEYRVLEREEILSSGFTTHDISPKAFMDFLDEETSADIYMLGMQPKNISFGDEMSEEVKRSLDEISGLIISTLCL